MRALSERDTKRQPPPTNLPPNLPPADRSHDRIIGGGTRDASSHNNGPNATVKKYTCADRTRPSTQDMAKIEGLLAQRCIEKRRRQYAEADAIICELEAMGVWHDDTKLTYGTNDWKPTHAATPDGHPRYPGAAATPDGHPPYPGGGGTLGGASSLDTRSSHWGSRGGEKWMDAGLGQHRAVTSHTGDGGMVGGGGGGGNWETSDEHGGMGLPPCAQPPLEHGQAERGRFASRGGGGGSSVGNAQHHHQSVVGATNTRHQPPSQQTASLQQEQAHGSVEITPTMSALNSLSQHQPPTQQTASASQPHSSARSAAPPSDGGAVVGTTVPALEANGSRIYVGNLDYWTQAYEVRDVFRIYGLIKAHHMPFVSFRPGQIERSKGYMFIEYE